MSLFVVDASTGLKWFIPEVQSDAARRLQDSNHELHAPSLFDVECANVLWKKIRRAELTRAEADAILIQIPLLAVTRHPDGPLVSSAFDLADQTGRTVYDCLYLALAMRLNGRFATADQRFYRAMQGTAWGGSVLWIGDLAG
jgi:predicted nucleic acid-binding protein